MRRSVSMIVSRVALAGFIFASALLVSCAMKVSTLPIVTAGNTGCASDDLLLFNYDEGSRSWRAMCQGAFFVCSDVGRRTARCSPDRYAAQDQELALRTSLMQQLPAERRGVVLFGDIREGERDDYVQRVRILASMGDELASRVDDLDQIMLGLPDQALEGLRECRDVEGFVASVVRRPDLLRFRTDLSCWTWVLNDLGFDLSRVEDVEEVVVYLGPVDPSLVTMDVEAGVASAGAVGDAPPSAQGPEGAGELALAADPDVEAEMRGLLDAHRSDIMACAAAERVIVRLGYRTGAQVTVGLHGALAGSPEEGCVQAALSSVEWPTFEGEGEILHLVQGD